MNVSGIIAQFGIIDVAVFKFVYFMARPAVNVFVIISGYFMVNTQRRKIGKIIDLFIIVSSFQTVCHLMNSIAFSEPIALTRLIASIIPKNYYLFLYTTLYIISPYINILINSISERKFKILLITLLGLFSVYSTLINFALSYIDRMEMRGVYTVLDIGTGRGFSIVGFILMYLIGAYLSNYDYINSVF